MVVLLRPEEVPKDFICAICMSVPLEPCYIDSCQHVFCSDCFEEGFRRRHHCPVCRQSCSHYNLTHMEEGELLYRIWSTIMIKCDHHESGCGWTGSISDYWNHHANCQHEQRGRSEDDQDYIESLLEENEDLVCTKWSALQAKHDKLKQEFSAYKANAKKGKKACRKLLTEIPAPNERGGYNYDRFSVVELTKLVCVHLEEKPEEINGNKIFECVRNIYNDLKKDYVDNPDNYSIDVRMLFGVCLASAWFTNKQHNNLQKLAEERDWS